MLMEDHARLRSLRGGRLRAPAHSCTLEVGRYSIGDGVAPGSRPREDWIVDAPTPADGLEDLYRRYAGWFRSRVVRRYGVQDAEDLVQETWTRLAASMAGKEVRHPRALLLQIAGNLFVDRQRRRARRSRYLAEQEVAMVWGRRDGQSWAEGDLMSVGQDGALTVLRRDGLDPIDEKRGVGYIRGITADWMGSTPVIYARPDQGARFDWYGLKVAASPDNLTREMNAPPSRLNSVNDEGVFMVADGGVWLATARGARRLTATDEVFRDASIPTTDKPFRQLFNSPPRQPRALAVSGTGVVVSIGGDGNAKRLGKGGGGRLALSAISHGAALYLHANQVVEDLHLATPESDRTVDRVNQGYRNVVLPLPVDITHLDRTGRPTTSRLFMPQGRSLAEARGLILHVYPGTTQTGTWIGPQWLAYGLRAQILAGAGYAVLSPSIPDDPSGTMRADDLVRDVDLAVDAALARYPDLPEDRMAVVGHSFGGHASLALATRSDRFKSYVSWSGASDLFGAWGEFTPVSRQMPDIGFALDESQGWAEAGQGGRKVPPWADIESYVEGSPFLAANQIHAPVLLITADRDFVPVTHAERMFSALYRLGVRTRLVTYWGEEHFNWSPANIRDFYTQIFEWLDVTLGTPEKAAAPTP